MDLSVRDISELLKVSEGTVKKWIQEKNLPAYKVNNQYRFNRAEISEWILNNNITVSGEMLSLCETKQVVSISTLIKKGGIHSKIKGNTVFDVIKSAVEVIPLPPSVERSTVAYYLIEREEMMPTAIGSGIAVPHPRSPVISDISGESVSVCFLATPVEYHAIDGMPVHTIFIIISANSRRHLDILSKISFLCQKDDFLELLKKRASKKAIIDYIQKAESQFK